MKKTTSGFSIVELLIVVAIIGILSTIAAVTFKKIQADAADSQRSAKMTSLSEALEKYYEKNGEYPGCLAMKAAPNTVATNTLPGIDPTILTTPSDPTGTNSITCNDITSSSADVFAYIGTGADCATGSACSGYTLKYKEESTSNVKSITKARMETKDLVSISTPTGTTKERYTLSAGQVVPSSATVSYKWQRYNGSTYQDIAGATGPSYTLTYSEVNQTIRVAATGSGLYHGTVYSPLTTTVVFNEWKPALGQLASNIEVYYQSTTGAFGYYGSGCASLGKCQIGLDANYPTYASFSADNSLDFSGSTARTACKNVNGRLPTSRELQQIYQNAAAYGLSGGGIYWSSSEAGAINIYNAVYVNMSNGSVSTWSKGNTYGVRCVRTI